MDSRSIKWMIILTVTFMSGKKSYGYDQCSSYQILNTRDRAQKIPSGNTLKCDQRDLPAITKWYRFTGAAGSQIATSHVPVRHCGTHAPGWLSTSHPTRVGQIINAKVCFHWQNNACRWSTNIKIKKCSGFYVYFLVKPNNCWLRYCGNGNGVVNPDGCSNYQQLSDRARAAGVHRGNSLRCDQKDLITPKWYRFTGAAGTQMPTSPVPKHHCGTHAPGWLSGSHPTSVGQTVNGKVCFHWGGNNCQWNANIQIKKCNGFFVYKLAKTPVCWLRYCGNAGFDVCKVANPCKNGATCAMRNDGYQCLCKPGYQGRNCESDVNECTSKPCKNGGTCLNSPGSYTCKCKQGFLGKHCETVLDECSHYQQLNDRARAAGVHRGNSLRCDQKDLATPKWYRFTGAAGSQMPTSPVPKHHCGTHAPGWLSSPHPSNVGQTVNGKVCFHWGGNNCQWNANIQIKKCNGFFVYRLIKTPVCWLRYCGNAGFDECKVSSPCKNGATCKSQNDGYTCLCKPGYEGRNCERDVNECLTRPCQNGGTCQNLPGSYKCKCKQGFLGKHCETVFDECAHYEVLNDRERAAGVQRGNVLKCDQKDLPATPKWYRFTGAAGSQMPTSPVPKHHCGTHAPGWLSGSHPTSVGQTVNGKVCFHWGGNNCQWNANIQIKKCNGFFVYKLVRTPVCWLRYCGNAGFDPCKASSPCQNGATCKTEHGGYTCLCKPGYEGRNCERDVNECLTRPCQNGGTCQNLPGSYKCKCKDGFLGKHCETVFNECSHYEVLNDRERAAGVQRGNVLKCDQKDFPATPKWYRFTGAAGSQMPTSPVPKHHCGTHAPGWLSSPHPSSAGQTVNGKVCFHWGGNNCHWKANIQIKKCNGFYVYKLVRTPVCWLRYCGNAGFDPCKANSPCQNGATCKTEHDGYTCLCKPGYEGRNCERDVNECLTRPCQNGGTCQNLPGSYKCKCKDGYLGKHCETVFDECAHYEVLNDRERAAGVPRGNVLKCDQKDLTTPKWYRFTGAAGSQMPTSPVPKHHCGTHAPGWLSGSHPTSAGQTVNGKVCFHWGGNVCHWNANIQIKKCNGFYVYKLVRTPVCWLRYCGNAGFDPCKANSPCQNGATCKTEHDGYTCLCKPGYEGRNCERDVNECLTRPCQNGGTCQNLPGSYVCKCKDGFLGKHCETVFDECHHYKELNDRDRAAGVPRGNVLKCDQRDLTTPQWYRFTGAAGSQMPTSPVPKHRCGTHAPGWLSSPHPTSVGQIADGKVCFHWASKDCNWHANIQIKKCNGFYVYKLVRTPVCSLRYCGNAGFDECKVNSPCKNGATCITQNDGYTCLCKPGYEGRNCERDVDECLTRPCQNGGTCENLPGSYRCKCKQGFLGKHCETVFNECSHYEELNDTDRAAGNQAPNVVKCDQSDLVTPKWYRFRGAAGSQMPTSCVPENRCGTHAPGWLKGSHPTTDGQIVSGKVCFHWSGNCCRWSVNIRIKNCHGFYIYELVRTPACSLRYCGNSGYDECKVKSPCKNGATCAPGKNGYTCLCKPGYEGKDCEKDVDECLTRPCSNGATCENYPGGYNCKCKPGFEGKHCEKDKDECRSSPCKNGGSCSNLPGSYKCDCAPGYKGDHCDEDEDECKSGPCQNGGKCVNLLGSYKCDCSQAQGYEGKHCDKDVDECRRSPCKNGGNCTNLPGSYKCDCAPGYKGDNCDQDEDECKSGPCQNGGKCVNVPGSYKCDCSQAQGYEGKHCDNDMDECRSSPCKNGGSCTNLPGSYNCTCTQGYEGDHCEQEIDGCTSYRTLDEQDRAARPYKSSVVKCDYQDLVALAWYRFSGAAGDQMADSCVTKLYCGTHAPGWLKGDHPSSLGETVEREACFHWGNNCCEYSIKVKVKKCNGFYVYELPKTPTCYLRYCGNAGLDVNECIVQKPCKNGATCVDEVGGYSCRCASGFTGKNCDQDKDECKSGPCKNGGKCTNLLGSYKCDCSQAQGYEGKHCDKDVDECKSSPCKNGGNCTNLPGSFRCDCAPGYEGDHCDQDVDECRSSPCKNGGNCTNLPVPGSYKCDCAPGYKGDHCDQDVDECSHKPCKNSGMCNNTVGSYSCKCLVGFEGQNCDKDKDECKAGNPCQNGGTCHNKLGTYSCDCVEGYDGYNCENKKDFIEKGCYQDKSSDRVFGKKMLKNLRKYIIWQDMSKTVHNCSEIARGLKLKYFAIQYYGECWGGPDGVGYDKYGLAHNCWSGVGGSNSNYVYKLV